MTFTKTIIMHACSKTIRVLSFLNERTAERIIRIFDKTKRGTCADSRI